MPVPLSAAVLAFTGEGVPYSAAFDDVYHSKDGGLAQARDVFMAGNGLPERWRDRQSFAICETGFGLGLSFLATWATWRADAQRSKRLHFVSCELHPFTATDLATLYAHLFADQPDIAALGEQLIAQWPPLIAGTHRLELDEGRVVLTLMLGDAFDSLCNLAARIDAFYLDGFAPAKNPELWHSRLFKQFARVAGKEATLATYTVAGEVRRALTDAGFVVKKRPGFGRKRQMLVGTFRGPRPELNEPQDRHAIVIGAGMAGAAMAERLARRGWHVTILEREAAAAQGASGNHIGAYRPVVSVDDNLQARLARACFFHGMRWFERIPDIIWRQCGALQLARDANEAERFLALTSEHAFPAEFVRSVDQGTASKIAGVPVRDAGLWFPKAGWLRPTSLVTSLLEVSHAAIRYGAAVSRLKHADGEWIAVDDAGEELARAPVVILANAADATRLAPELEVSSDARVVTHLPAQAVEGVQTVVCGGGYLTPAHDGKACLGSVAAEQASTDAHAANLALRNQMLLGAKVIDPSTLDGRRCARPNTVDRLPIAGQLADPALFEVKHAGSLHRAPRLAGLYALTGFGARGLLWCGLLADLVASQIAGEPLPLERDLVLAVDPARFLARRLLRTEG